MNRLDSSPTIEELTELYGQDLGSCQVRTGIGIGRWGRMLRPCRRNAQHLVLFTCPQHGSSQVRVCGLHMQMLRSRLIGPIRCTTCHRPGRWKDNS